jgi:hypothetical protein
VSAERLNALEFLGVISTRLAHRLSNFQAAVAGNLAIHDAPGATEQQRAEAIASVREAARRSGEMLDRFSDLARSLRPNQSHCGFLEFSANVSTWISARPDWKLEITPVLSARNDPFALAGPWKWFAFCLDAIAAEARAGEIKIDRTTAPLGPPLLEQRAASYIIVVIVADGTESIDWHAHRERLESWNFTAAYELLQYFGARPRTDVENGRARTHIILPLIDPST